MEVGKSKTYKVLDFEEESRGQDSFSTNYDEVVSEFAEFVPSISPLLHYHRTDTDFKELLTKWLVTIDSFSSDEIRRSAKEYIKKRILKTMKLSLMKWIQFQV